jgi:alkylated DNA repair protein (DNA oxidative demethylase)
LFAGRNRILAKAVRKEGFVEDLVIRKGFLSLAEQKDVLAQVARIEPGFYRPRLRTGAQMNLLMNCLGWHWSAVSYRYTRLRDVDNQPAAPIPNFLQLLTRRALDETNYWRGPEPVPPYDICIVNWYDEASGKLGVHADNSETEQSLTAGYPVVSLSIGATCIFTFGGLTRKEPQREIPLYSGDLVLFGRSLRLAYHGVKKIVRGTTPAGLELKEPGRLNLTFRIM